MNFTIRPLNDSDSIPELTLLVRRAYKILGDMGFNYTGTYQDDDTTRSRIRDGECYVMLGAEQIVGTIVLYPANSLSWIADESWYAKPGVSLFGQFAVEPELRGSGLGSRLLEFIEERAYEIGATELALDTSEGATHLIHFYEKRGYRFIEYVQHSGKTYRSVTLSKTLGPRASE